MVMMKVMGDRDVQAVGHVSSFITINQLMENE